MTAFDAVPASCAGLVLAGGRGRRFGGQDKGLQHYRGKPLVEHALAGLRGCDRLLISANRNLDRYRALGAEVVSDRRADYQGPLSGIESALSQIDADWLYVIPCDLIGVPADWRQQLQAQAAMSGSPWVGSVAEARLQPLLSLWSRALLPRLSKFLDAGERRVSDFVAPWAERAVPLPAGCRLHNLNSQELLDRA